MDVILGPGLVLNLPLYRLDGVSFMSRDACGHLCTVTGALWRHDGRYFDGSDDKINCGTSLALDLTGCFTIEAWIKPGGSGSRTIINRASDAFIFQVGMPDSNKLGMYVRGGWRNSNYDIASDVWSHVAAVFDGANTIYYANGILVATVTTSGAYVSGANATHIGVQNAVNYFSGRIGEVRIYNRALNPFEVQHNYLATKRRYR